MKPETPLRLTLLSIIALVLLTDGIARAQDCTHPSVPTVSLAITGPDAMGNATASITYGFPSWVGDRRVALFLDGNYYTDALVGTASGTMNVAISTACFRREGPHTYEAIATSCSRWNDPNYVATDTKSLSVSTAASVSLAVTATDPDGNVTATLGYSFPTTHTPRPLPDEVRKHRGKHEAVRRPLNFSNQQRRHRNDDVRLPEYEFVESTRPGPFYRWLAGVFRKSFDEERNNDLFHRHRLLERGASVRGHRNRMQPVEPGELFQLQDGPSRSRPHADGPRLTRSFDHATEHRHRLFVPADELPDAAAAGTDVGRIECDHRDSAVTADRESHVGAAGRAYPDRRPIRCSFTRRPAETRMPTTASSRRNATFHARWATRLVPASALRSASPTATCA